MNSIVYEISLRAWAWLRDNRVMRSLRDLRVLYQNHLLTRALACPDGLIRIVPLHVWVWRDLDALLDSVPSVDDQTLLDSILGHILPATDAVAIEQGCDPETALRNLLHYYIAMNHATYVGKRDNLANDNYPPCESG